MNFLNDAYLKCISDNERNLRFWEDYVNNLKSLNFSMFNEKLTVPTLVPIGSRIFFKGELKHTNEITAALGADYFVKCSVKQAEVLRQHRLKDAQTKLDIYRKEKEYLENQMSFCKKNIYEDLGQEIVEVYTEEEDRAWREKHRENVRQNKKKDRTIVDESATEVTDEELWNRLEELELQEELENELSNMDISSETEINKPADSFIVYEPDVIFTPKNKQIMQDEDKHKQPDIIKRNADETPEQTTKLDLLQQIIEKQNELEQKLLELKNKEKGQTKSEQDLMSRMDELEELEELEDEMDRLEDIVNTEEVKSSDDEDSLSKSSNTTFKRGVTFADEDDSATLEIVFKHSAVEPSKDSFDPERGITKPCDIYAAYSHLFSETTSILKKSKYSDKEETETDEKTDKQMNKIISMPEMEPEDIINRTIVVKDVIERVDQNENKLENNESRPSSLFKKRRLQKKS